MWIIGYIQVLKKSLLYIHIVLRYIEIAEIIEGHCVGKVICYTLATKWLIRTPWKSTYLIDLNKEYRIVLIMNNSRNTFPVLTEASAIFYCCEDKPRKKSLKTKKVNKKTVQNKCCEANDRKIGKEVLFINSCYYIFIIS